MIDLVKNKTKKKHPWSFVHGASFYNRKKQIWLPILDLFLLLQPLYSIAFATAVAYSLKYTR